jgi:hypothetical protein
LVLTGKKSDVLKYQLVKYGALGAVNGFSEKPIARGWPPVDQRVGRQRLGIHERKHSPFVLLGHPRQAQRLRQILASGKKVIVRAVADTRYYEGRYPWVTGVIPGVSPDEEVLVLAQVRHDALDFGDFEGPPACK